MVALLEELAPDQIGSGAKGPNRITIVASERTNSLVIKGDTKSVSRTIELIRRLDVPANRAGSTQVIRLSHSNAEEIAEILKNIIKESSEEDSNNIGITIQPDVHLNALVVRADPTNMLELKALSLASM